MRQDDRVDMSTTCPTGAITSFPLQLAISATDALYEGVSEPVTIDFQWASRATPPMFISPQQNAVTDEIAAGNSNLTTLRYMNKSYTIAAVQIIQASHTAWILPASAQTNNKEDIAITFSSGDSANSYAYLTFIIPILRSSVGSPSYLQGLSNPSANGPFSIQSCFPTSERANFAYYATCLAGYSKLANTQNSYIFVNTNGIQVSSTLMTKILEITGRTGSFAQFSPPYISRLTNTRKSIRSITEFSSYVLTTNQLLNYTEFVKQNPTLKTNVRQDNTDAYQCVPIDPDASVVDGKINVDLSTGQVLTEVLTKRNAVLTANNVKPSMDPGRLEKYMGTAIGIVLSIVLFWIIIQFAAMMFIDQGPGVDQGGSWLTSVPTYGVIILIAGFIGFVVGTMIN
jgi:hypothetical protein